MGLIDQVVEVVHGAEMRIELTEVTCPVAMVAEIRLILFSFTDIILNVFHNRTDPDRVHT